MARRKRREGHSLHKVLGVGALFSTAYGNVGSSIYYALGVVAVAALGLTPAVFVITGVLFIATAWSYSEATAAMPEAGGASSFTRRAFNEFASFGIGWAQMLTYTATIAISALFVPQYLSIFWPILKEPPYNIIGGAITIVVLVVINIVGIKEAASLNVALALLDLGTQVLIMIIALVLLLEPNDPDLADPLGHRADLGPVPVRPRHRHRGLHRHRDHLQHGGGGAPSGQGRAALDQLRHHRRARRVHRHAAGGALVDEGRTSTQVPVDPATGKTVPVEVVPGEPEGTYRPQVGPQVTVYVPRGGAAERHHGSSRRRSRPGAVETVDGQQVTKLYGTQLGSNYLADPVLGMVRFLPDNVAWLRWILGPGSASSRRRSSSSPPTPASSACRAWRSRWASTASCRASSGASIRRGSRRTWRSSSSASSP